MGLVRTLYSMPISSFQKFSLGTNFVYLPKSVAEPPSALRTIAYREGTPLIGPMNDPEGWKVLDVIEVKGSLYASKAVSVRCTVSGLKSSLSLYFKPTASSQLAIAAPVSEQ